MTDLTPEDIASVNAAYWASIAYKIKLQSGVFSFKDHSYQMVPMVSNCHRKCYMKGAQGGFTEFESIIKSLHGMIHGRYPKGVLCLFPNDDDMQDFAKSRFNPIIYANREAIGKWVKAGGRKGTDMASLKKIHDAFLYLRGATLTHKSGGEVLESAKLRSIPVDRVVFEEPDLMDDAAILKALARMGHSEVKEEVYLSNPTTPNWGIHSIFQRSDQRYWHRKCPKCNEWTCAELTFPSCVKIRKDGTGYIGCKKCGAELPLGVDGKTGEWVAAEPKNRDTWGEGYRWSQLTSIFNDPADILNDYINPPDGNIGDVYRLQLGLPYIAKEDQLRLSNVYECCGQDIMAPSSKEQCAMGVDIGITKHVVIGVRTGNDRFEIIKVIRLSKLSDIHDLAQRFNVKSAVIDMKPFIDLVRQFQKDEKYRIYLCDYSESTVLGSLYNDNTGILKQNRTEIFDATHRLIVNKQITFPRRELGEMAEFAKQVCEPAKILETNKKTNTPIFRYRGNNDHYRNALNYFYLAAQGGKIANTKTYKNRQLQAVNDYARI